MLIPSRACARFQLLKKTNSFLSPILFDYFHNPYLPARPPNVPSRLNRKIDSKLMNAHQNGEQKEPLLLFFLTFSTTVLFLREVGFVFLHITIWALHNHTQSVTLSEPKSRITSTCRGNKIAKLVPSHGQYSVSKRPTNGVKSLHWDQHSSN